MSFILSPILLKEYPLIELLSTSVRYATIPGKDKSNSFLIDLQL